MKLSTILLVLLSSPLALAANWYPNPTVLQKDAIKMEPLRCPTVGKDYQEMVNQLSNLQDKIKGDAQCENLKGELKKLKSISGERREKYLTHIEKLKKGESIKDVDMEKYVLGYVEDVTMTSGALGTLLSDSGQCFGDLSPTDSLFTLSTFVNEASALMSTVAGPWGPALAVGGKVASGFLKGLSKFIASRPGFDFHDKRQWQGYVETLCAFHSQQDDIYALLHPGKAIGELENLENQANIHLQSLMAVNPMGIEIKNQFVARSNEGLNQLLRSAGTPEEEYLSVTTVQLLSAQGWIQNRKKALEEEAADPLAPGKYLVQKHRDEIEEFLIDRQGPKFLNYQIRETEKALRELEQFAFTEGRHLYVSLLDQKQSKKEGFFRRRPAAISTQEILKEIMTTDEVALLQKDPNNEELASNLLYFKRELEQKWGAVNNAYGVKLNTCEFMQLAGYYSTAMKNTCSSSRVATIEAQIERLEKMGLLNEIPSYLLRAKRFQGLSWTESLDAWMDTLTNVPN